MTDSFVLGHGPAFAAHPLYPCLEGDNIRLRPIGQPEDLLGVEVVLLDAPLLQAYPLDAWQALATTLVSFEALAGALPLPATATLQEVRTLLAFAAEQSRLRDKTRQLTQALHSKQGDLQRLVDVGLALSAEKDLERLLGKILTEGRRLSHCDAASLFLV